MTAPQQGFLSQESSASFLLWMYCLNNCRVCKICSGSATACSHSLQPQLAATACSHSLQPQPCYLHKNSSIKDLLQTCLGSYAGVIVRCSQWLETGVTALLSLARVRKYSNLVHLVYSASTEHARVRKYSNLVHLVYSASTEQDECILDRKYEILGCICGA